MKTSIRVISVSAILLLTIGCGGSDGSDGSSGNRLEGEYSGVVRDVAPIQFNWSQSGTSISGTVTFKGKTYDYTGTLSGDVLNGNNINQPNASECVFLSMPKGTVSSDRLNVTGPMTIRQGSCEGGRVKVTPGKTFDVVKY